MSIETSIELPPIISAEQRRQEIDLMRTAYDLGGEAYNLTRLGDAIDIDSTHLAAPERIFVLQEVHNLPDSLESPESYSYYRSPRTDEPTLVPPTVDEDPDIIAARAELEDTKSLLLIAAALKGKYS